MINSIFSCKKLPAQQAAKSVRAVELLVHGHESSNKKSNSIFSNANRSSLMSLDRFCEQPEDSGLRIGNKIMRLGNVLQICRQPPIELN